MTVVFIWGYKNPFVFTTLSQLSDVGKQYERLIKALNPLNPSAFIWHLIQYAHYDSI